MSDPPIDAASPVDEPPGKDGTQPPNPPDTPPVPEWAPGANPPGTNPPIPTPNTGTTPLPGMTPGVIAGETPPTPVPTDPPVNVDAPYVSQDANVLNCTMGNWEGEPTDYSYLWTIDGIEIAGSNAYPILSADIGMTATCTVTATNAVGSTTAPPSNEIVIT